MVVRTVACAAWPNKVPKIKYDLPKISDFVWNYVLKSSSVR